MTELPPPGDYGNPQWMDELIAKRVLEHYKNLEDALIQVGLAGGGKVVEPIPNPNFQIIKVLAGQDESALPDPRVERLVPPNSVIRG